MGLKEAAVGVGRPYLFWHFGMICVQSFSVEVERIYFSLM